MVRSIDSRRFSALVAVVLFVSCLALQPGFSQQSDAPQATATVKAPRYASVADIKPFSKLAIGVTFGTTAIGIEAVTPLSHRSNLRFDGSLFNYNTNITENGVNYNANLRLRDVRATFDFFPFVKSFHLSAGVALYNQFNLAGTAVLPPGNTVTLNSVDYSSQAGTTPINASAGFVYGNKVAPVLAFGWGNAIPRNGHHFAFPIELGVAFTGTPSFNLLVGGNGCTTVAPIVCGPVTSLPDFQTNFAAEKAKIQNDVNPLKVYPIATMGMTYRF
jgi:hypothetical protein